MRTHNLACEFMYKVPSTFIYFPFYDMAIRSRLLHFFVGSRSFYLRLGNWMHSTISIPHYRSSILFLSLPPFSFGVFFQLSSIQPVDERVLSAHIAYRIYLNGNHSVVDGACFLHSTPHEMTTTITDNHSMHVNISAQKRENKTFWNCNRTWFYDLFITNGLVCVFVVGSLPSDWLNR